MSTVATPAFVLGHHYTRPQISLLLGGSTQSFLPHKAGVVLCGCCDPAVDMNPNAPEEVLFGLPHPTPAIELCANLVFAQGTKGMEIPVFLKCASNAWEYVGEYLCIGITRDARVVTRKLALYPKRGKFSGVLRFERVDTGALPAVYDQHV